MVLARVSVIQTPSKLVLNKISMLLSDDVLKVLSSQATEAVEAASMLLDWYKEDANNKHIYKVACCFTKQLLHSLRLSIFGTDGNNV